MLSALPLVSLQVCKETAHLAFELNEFRIRIQDLSRFLQFGGRNLALSIRNLVLELSVISSGSSRTISHCVPLAKDQVCQIIAELQGSGRLQRVTVENFPLDAREYKGFPDAAVSNTFNRLQQTLA